jgi:aquaporin Z
MKYSNITIFVAELLGTFGLLVAATGSIVYDDKVGGILGIIFISSMHFVGLTIVVYAFGKYSMAHFNPAVTIGFYIAGFTKKNQLPFYFVAQAIGAFLGTFFVKYVFGDFAGLGTNSPNYSYPFAFFYTIEIAATILLMGVILCVVHNKRLNKFSGLAIGGIIGLDVLFFGEISGASMNPIRSISPALVSGMMNDLWIYLTSPIIGAVIVALIYRKKFSNSKNTK